MSTLKSSAAYRTAMATGIFVAALAVTAFATGSASVWSGPTQPPPGGNVPAPVNVGSTEQTKFGSLILNADPTSTAPFGLMMFGKIQIRGGNPGAGKVLTATDDLGSAEWQDVVQAPPNTPEFPCKLEFSSGTNILANIVAYKGKIGCLYTPNFLTGISNGGIFRVCEGTDVAVVGWDSGNGKNHSAWVERVTYNGGNKTAMSSYSVVSGTTLGVGGSPTVLDSAKVYNACGAQEGTANYGSQSCTIQCLRAL